MCCNEIHRASYTIRLHQPPSRVKTSVLQKVHGCRHQLSAIETEDLHHPKVCIWKKHLKHNASMILRFISCAIFHNGAILLETVEVYHIRDPRRISLQLWVAQAKLMLSRDWINVKLGGGHHHHCSFGGATTDFKKSDDGCHRLVTVEFLQSEVLSVVHSVNQILHTPWGRNLLCFKTSTVRQPICANVRIETAALRYELSLVAEIIQESLHFVDHAVL
mmetsp:Transcript_84135/g.224913  ORF Transcript_84135/g.224913 Transcript_84135/m.224913 type:complete len:219 (+) Transcript_84135:3047-3703(+)